MLFLRLFPFPFLSSYSSFLHILPSFIFFLPSYSSFLHILSSFIFFLHIHPSYSSFLHILPSYSSFLHILPSYFSSLHIFLSFIRPSSHHSSRPSGAHVLLQLHHFHHQGHQTPPKLYQKVTTEKIFVVC